MLQLARRLTPRWLRRALNRSFALEAPPVAAAWNRLLFELRLDRACRRTKSLAQALSGQRGLKLHLGCGVDIRSGWINIDLAAPHELGRNEATDSHTRLWHYDLRRGLPLEDCSCDYIYSSHFFEHLEFREGLALMRDCYRVLAPEGIFRIALPNIRLAFEAYLRNDRAFYDLADQQGFISDLEPGIRRISDCINWVVYQEGTHKAILDQETVISMLERLGYHSVKADQFSAEVDIDQPIRRQYTFYVQGQKPAVQSLKAA